MRGLDGVFVLILGGGGVADTIVHPNVPTFFLVHFLTLILAFLGQVVVVLVCVAADCFLAGWPWSVGTAALIFIDRVSDADVGGILGVLPVLRGYFYVL